MKKVNVKLTESKWKKFPEDEEIQLKIRPFPVSQGMFIPGISNETMWEYLLKKFLYCVEDWKGFVDENDKPLECNEDNKTFVYNYFQDIVTFAITEIAEVTYGVKVVPEKKT